MKILFNLITTILLSTTIWATDGVTTTKAINASESSVSWEGKKVTGKHNGLVSIAEGSLQFDDGALTGGTVVMDMSSITVEDLQGEWGQKLLGHLQSDDFFSIEKHPTATLVITSVAQKDGGEYGITADLTIKGTTKPVAFDAQLTDSGASAKITIDRTDYDIRYGSGKFFDNLGDKTIYDDFTLDISLVF